MPHSILVTRRPPGEALDLLTAAADVDLWDRDSIMPREELLARVADVDGLYCMLTDVVDEDLLARAPRLRAVSSMSVGVDNVDLAACSRRGIPVGHTPGVLTETTADLAMALLLAAARRMREGNELIRRDEWGDWKPDLLLGQDVHSSVIGIIGMGRIGKAVARRAVGFGMSILYAGPHPKPEVEEELGAQRREFAGLLKMADHVVVTAPLNAATYHLIDAAALRLMKPTATLVNVARGGIVDTDALVDALAVGSIAAAGLDVTDPEPLRSDHPLVLLSNCVLTPHLGSASVQARNDMAALAARNLLLALDGKPMEACVSAGG